MFAVFQISGRVVEVRDELYRVENIGPSSVAHSFSTRGCRLSGPEEPPGSTSFSSFVILSGGKSTEAKVTLTGGGGVGHVLRGSGRRFEEKKLARFWRD